MPGKFNFHCAILILLWASLIQAQNQIQRQAQGEKGGYVRQFFGAATSGFGGSAVKISRIDDQTAILSGGRGAAVINHRVTFGGGGYRIVNQIILKSGDSDTIHLLKVGYGGLEFGYLFFPDYKRLNAGTSLLIGVGAGFIESQPETPKKSFSVFPVIEPALYGEAPLSSHLRLHLGVTFRLITGCRISRVSSGNISGTSGYINLLFGTE